MKDVYIDTSAFFKIFIEEEANDVVERIILLAKEKKIRIILSDWVINESIALIDENRRREKIKKIETQTILSEIVDMIQAHVEYGNFTFYSISEKVVVNSRFIIQDFHIPASDALHVFIAISAGCDCIISADKELVTQVKENSSLLAFNVRVQDDVKRMFELLQD